MDMKADHIVWSSNEFKLKFILDNPNFGLPQIVRVVQGYMVDEDDSLASGQVLTLHGQKRIEKLNGRDNHGKEVSIPINCKYKVKLISAGARKFFNDVKEVCACEKLPASIMTQEALSSGTDSYYPKRSLLRPISRLKSDDGDIIGLQCSVDTTSELIHLPISFSGSFEEAMEPSGKRYFLWEVVKEFGLPVEVQFLPVTDRSCGYGPQLGSLYIDKVATSEVVMATSVLDDVRYAMTFSADIPVTIQVAKGMLDNLATYDETRKKSHLNVDLKKFDYFINADPYNTAVFQNEIYDDLATPVAPRRVRISPYHQTQPEQNTLSLPRQNKRGQTKPALKQTNREIHSEPNSLPGTLTRVPSKLKDIKELETYVRDKLSLKKSKTKSKSAKDLTSSKSSSDTMTSQNSTISSYRSCTEFNPDQNLSPLEIHTNGSNYSRVPLGNITDCMDTRTLEQTMVEQPCSRSSSDSGVFLSRKRSVSHKDSAQNTQGRKKYDKFVAWDLPPDEEPCSLERSPSVSSSLNFLWGIMDAPDTNNNEMKKVISTKSSYKAEIISDQSKDTISTCSPPDQFMEMSYSSRSETSSQNEAEFSSSPLESRQLKSMSEVRSLTEDGVAKVLSSLKMIEYIDIFKENQINGELLITLDVADFITELKLSIFQAKKLIKYIRGWRPSAVDTESDKTSRRNSLNPRDWTEDDVMIHMNSINLPDFALFCKHNQVNGELLLDILDTDTLQSLRIDHHVKISNLESKKLLNFVVKGWRPDSSPKKTAPT